MRIVRDRGVGGSAGVDALMESLQCIVIFFFLVNCLEQFVFSCWELGWKGRC